MNTLKDQLKSVESMVTSIDNLVTSSIELLASKGITPDDYSKLLETIKIKKMCECKDECRPKTKLRKKRERKEKVISVTPEANQEPTIF